MWPFVWKIKNAPTQVLLMNEAWNLDQTTATEGESKQNWSEQQHQQKKDDKNTYKKKQNTHMEEIHGDKWMTEAQKDNIIVTIAETILQTGSIKTDWLNKFHKLIIFFPMWKDLHHTTPPWMQPE